MAFDDISDHIPKDLLDYYEFRSHRHAAAILAMGCKELFGEILEALRQFRITIADIRKPGGNESDIPKKIAELLRPKQWLETRIRADLHVYAFTKQPRAPGEKKRKTRRIDLGKRSDEHFINSLSKVRKAYIDGHKVDFVKGDVAFDFEWNSKDQTFDRDLFALSAFYDCGLISAGIVCTRAQELNLVFKALGPELDAQGNVRFTKDGKPKMLAAKYGASTTWLGKLTSRIEAGRAGGCPILAIGIRQEAISDWEAWEKANPGAVEGVDDPDTIEDDDDDEAGSDDA